MVDPSPAPKTFAALAALVLTVAGFQQVIAVPPAYAAARVAALA